MPVDSFIQGEDKKECYLFSIKTKAMRCILAFIKPGKQMTGLTWCCKFRDMLMQVSQPSL